MAKKPAIRGLHIDPPKPTGAAYLLAVVYLGLPVIAFLALIDLVLYAVFRFGFDRCYGVSCLF